MTLGELIRQCHQNIPVASSLQKVGGTGTGPLIEQVYLRISGPSYTLIQNHLGPPSVKTSSLNLA